MCAWIQSLDPMLKQVLCLMRCNTKHEIISHIKNTFLKNSSMSVSHKHKHHLEVMIRSYAVSSTVNFIICFLF